MQSYTNNILIDCHTLNLHENKKGDKSLKIRLEEKSKRKDFFQEINIIKILYSPSKQ